VKTCRTCKSSKPLGEFYRRPDSPDGYRNECKPCWKKKCAQHYANDRENQREYRRTYYRKKLAENPDFHKEKYWADLELARQQNKENYLRHREKRVAQAVEYAKNNRAKANATGKKYKAAKRNACPPWVLASPDLCGMMEDVYLQAQELTQETGVMHHVDHIIPLQGRGVCGLHVPWNLQVLTASENCSKQNKVLEDAA
jgi:hypothetical protein